MPPNAGRSRASGISGKAGINDDLGIGELWKSPDARDELPAVHLRHGEVGKDDAWSQTVLELRERRGATRGEATSHTDGVEVLDDGAALLLGVVDNEDRVAM